MTKISSISKQAIYLLTLLQEKVSPLFILKDPQTKDGNPVIEIEESDLFTLHITPTRDDRIHIVLTFPAPENEGDFDGGEIEGYVDDIRTAIEPLKKYINDANLIPLMNLLKDTDLSEEGEV